MLGGAFHAIAKEMAGVLFRMSYSSIIRESEDLGAGIFDRHGNNLAESDSTPMFMGAMPKIVKNVIRILGADIHDGDVILHNVLHHLNILPFMLAGMFFGWRGALKTILLATVLQGPSIYRHWFQEPLDAQDQVVEISTFGVAAVIAGLLADRERTQRRRVEATKVEAPKVEPPKVEAAKVGANGILLQIIETNSNGGVGIGIGGIGLGGGGWHHHGGGPSVGVGGSFFAPILHKTVQAEAIYVRR